MSAEAKLESLKGDILIQKFLGNANKLVQSNELSGAAKILKVLLGALEKSSELRRVFKLNNIKFRLLKANRLFNSENYVQAIKDYISVVAAAMKHTSSFRGGSYNVRDLVKISKAGMGGSNTGGTIKTREVRSPSYVDRSTQLSLNKQQEVQKKYNKKLKKSFSYESLLWTKRDQKFSEINIIPNEYEQSEDLNLLKDKLEKVQEEYKKKFEKSVYYQYLLEIKENQQCSGINVIPKEYEQSEDLNLPKNELEQRKEKLLEEIVTLEEEEKELKLFKKSSNKQQELEEVQKEYKEKLKKLIDYQYLLYMKKDQKHLPFNVTSEYEHPENSNLSENELKKQVKKLYKEVNILGKKKEELVQLLNTESQQSDSSIPEIVEEINCLKKNSITMLHHCSNSFEGFVRSFSELDRDFQSSIESSEEESDKEIKISNLKGKLIEQKEDNIKMRFLLFEKETKIVSQKKKIALLDIEIANLKEVLKNMEKKYNEQEKTISKTEKKRKNLSGFLKEQEIKENKTQDQIKSLTIELKEEKENVTKLNNLLAECEKNNDVLERNELKKQVNKLKTQLKDQEDDNSVLLKKLSKQTKANLFKVVPDTQKETNVEEELVQLLNTANQQSNLNMHRRVELERINSPLEGKSSSCNITFPQ